MAGLSVKLFFSVSPVIGVRGLMLFDDSTSLTLGPDGRIYREIGLDMSTHLISRVVWKNLPPACLCLDCCVELDPSPERNDP